MSVCYRVDPVLYNVDFTVPEGIVMGIVGPNGAGKSTLIKAMLGLVKPLTGSAQFFGQPLANVRERVGYMPQSVSVDWDFPTTVIDVVMMGTYGKLGWLRRRDVTSATKRYKPLNKPGSLNLHTAKSGNYLEANASAYS